MNFAEFQIHRERLLRERRGLLDCSVTNLYATLARFIPPVSEIPAARVHRCHLASEWVERFGFVADASRRALISCGVRDSLGLLFRHYAGRGAHVWLPSDNYPVYADLATETGVTFSEFPTLPSPAWPSAEVAAQDELLLITNPMKPLGRWLSPGDVAALTAWLSAKPSRRLLLDAVYTFAMRFHPTTLQLLATGQAILLHSLTKGWLQPRLFGIALVPELDTPALTPVFRGAPPPQDHLARARELMSRHQEVPGAIVRELELGCARLLAALPSDLPLAAHGNAPGYFQIVAQPWQELLEQTNILGLPASVFGSCEEITVLSSLAFIA